MAGNPESRSKAVSALLRTPVRGWYYTVGAGGALAVSLARQMELTGA